MMMMMTMMMMTMNLFHAKHEHDVFLDEMTPSELDKTHLIHLVHTYFYSSHIYYHLDHIHHHHCHDYHMLDDGHEWLTILVFDLY